MITQNNKELTKDIEVIESLKDIKISKDGIHILDLEHEAIERLRYILQAHYIYIEELADNYGSKEVSKEITGFYYLTKDLFKEIEEIAEVKSKYITGLERKISNSLFHETTETG